MATQIFVNIVVQDLEKSKEFFTKLGFSFNPQFTDDTAACMVISDTIYFMIHTPESIKRFTAKELTDPKTSLEAIYAVSVESKEAVDEIVNKAIEAGGNVYRETEDYGWMYNRAIEDLDRHVWEFLWMNPTHIEK